MEEFATLPDIDSVEVLRLASDYEPVPRQPSIPGRVLTRLVGEPAHRVASLWRALLEAEPMRCHLPRYGLRFHGPELALEAALCFRCNNVSIIKNGEHAWATFDGEAAAARELLSIMRSFDPSTDAGGKA